MFSYYQIAKYVQFAKFQPVLKASVFSTLGATLTTARTISSFRMNHTNSKR